MNASSPFRVRQWTTSLILLVLLIGNLAPVVTGNEAGRSDRRA